MVRFAIGSLVAACASIAHADGALDPDADFAARRSAPGVVRAVDFDGAIPVTRFHADQAIQPGWQTTPQLDTQVKSSGKGSLRFDIPEKGFDNSSGAFYTNFSPDLSVRFGEGQEFFVQWRQRFSASFLVNKYAAKGGGVTSAKLAIVTAGDTAQKKYGSCEAIGVVTASWSNKVPISYDSCTGSASHKAYKGMYQPAPKPAFWLIQNGMPKPSCPYGGPGSWNDRTLRGVPPTCFPYYADEWMTFEQRLKLGHRVGDEWVDSVYQLWVAREGQQPVLVIDWRPGIPGYWQLTAGKAAEDQRFGKVWLTPFMTKRDANAVAAAPATIWYDELLISTQPIAFPGGHALRVPRN
jgi:hypothetical protein